MSALGPKGPPTGATLAALEGLILDCDGVVTPGDLYYDETGRRILRFHVKDGLVLALLCRQTGLPVGVLSGRPSDIAEQRMRELGVRAFVGQCRDKAEGAVAMCQELRIAPERCAYVGDDIPDLAAFSVVGLRVAVADAAAEVRDAAHWITEAKGGKGAVREVGEAILKARGDWANYVNQHTVRKPG